MSTDKAFTHAIPKVYETYLVPLLFEPYAADLAARLGSRRVTRVLEIAAGTGVVTRRLAATLPKDVSIVASDLNQAMLDEAAVSTVRAHWRFIPARRDGVAVESRAEVPIRFRLTGDEG